MNAKSCDQPSGEGDARVDRVPGGTAARMDFDDGRRKVAPTLTGRVNTLAPLLKPKACWRLDDRRFDFDSSFILPTAAREFALLAELRPPQPGGTGAAGSSEEAPEPRSDEKPLRMTVFGHADPTNKDAYNKALSGRRAMAVYALLVRDTALWEELYSHPYHGDKWGTRHIQIMLRAAGYPAATESGYLDEHTTLAVRQFQGDHGLPATGFPDPATRQELYKAYMDVICAVDGQPFCYAREDFLAQGKGNGGKGDYQGCGELNPVLVFSKAEDKEFSKPENKAARDSENLSNRRVVVHMFPPHLCLPVAQWPCPAVADGDAACRAKFWPDGDARRAPGETRREHLKGGRTFACLFYDRLARGSPCEGVRKTVRLTLLGRDGKWAAREPYRLELSGDLRTGVTTDTGSIIEEAVSAGSVAQIWWGDPDDATDRDGHPPHYAEYAQIFLNTAEPDADRERAERELWNLGLRHVEAQRSRQTFAAEYLNPDTSDPSIHLAHGEGIPKACRIPQGER